MATHFSSLPHHTNYQANSCNIAIRNHFPLSTLQLLKHKSDVNFVNEHGNTALHYACFWQNDECAEDLLECGAIVSIENKYGESPVDKAPGRLAKRLMGN